ncbi:MAG TPA: hypothetical protein VMS71_03035, partial [Candidatus Acidoferrum sp.]|nr:hypothetical protein [Candidatus Acidoferrum sp.]
AHVLRLIREILYFEPQGIRTDIPGALEHFNRVIKRKSVLFVISDFLSEGFFKPLQIANNKHDVIAVKISDPRESEFENFGLVELEDTETGEILLVDTSSLQFRKEFAARAQEDYSALCRGFQLINLDFINIRTDQSYIVPLINFFKMRERRH